MLVLKMLLLAYVICLVVSYFVASAAIRDRAYRAVFILLCAVLPFLIVFGIVKALFVKPQPQRLSPEMAAVEDAIEMERVKLFGCEPLCPSISLRIQRAYEQQMQVLAAETARVSRRVDDFWAHSNWA